MLYITFPQYLSYFQILFQRVHKLIKIYILKRFIYIILYYLIWAQYFAKIRSLLRPVLNFANGVNACMLSNFSHVRLCNSMDCSLPCSSVHGILQARKLEWVAMCSHQRIFLTQGSKLSPVLQADSLPTEPQLCQW